ncbi:ESPR-type extended signal peptide-containing protein, partial [Haemophilus haemolyticus]|uniref:ESPR-type extended signal peptide-containing protein n=1 Tax=Haemophilus haemolyticus TaxID=726 RepID=UPI0023AB4AA9
MNRVFKVIWNKTTQRTEVVSELARGMAKSSSNSVVNTTKLVKPVLKLSLLSICLGYPTWAMAATGAENGAVKYGDYGIAIGGYNGGAQVGPKPKEGNRIAAVGNRQISIGHDKLVASGNNSIVIGTDYGHANAWGLTYRQGGTQGFNTVGIGAGAQSIGLNALALGAASGSGVGYQGYDDAVYLGSFSRIAPKGLGQNYTDTEINNFNNTYVTAVEAFNKNQNENTLNAVKEAGRKINNAALNKVEGMTIKSNVDHPSIAGKFTTQTQQVTPVNGSSGTTTVSILSVGGKDGNNTMYRQIQNVAAGRIASDSNDAVNGSQLYYVRNYTGWNIGHYDDVTKATTTTGRVNNDHTVIFKPGNYTDVWTSLDSTNRSTVNIEVKTANLGTETANGKISKITVTDPIGTDANNTVARTAGVKSVLDKFNEVKADKVDIMGYSHVNETDADKVTENRIITAKNWDNQFDNNSGTYHESAGAKGNRAITSGVRANALANDSIAIGSLANVNNNWGSQLVAAERSIAIGREATVNAGKDSIAMGSGAQILHSDATTLNANNSIAIGKLSKIDQASNAIALGNKASVGGNYSSNGSWNASDNSIAIGNETTVSRENSIGIGTNVSVARENSVVIGQNASATKERVVAIGAYATANGDRTVAIGPEATANGSRSIVIGGIGDKKAIAEKDYSIVIGNGAQATDNATYSVTLGNNAKTAGATGISIGDRAQVVANAANGIALGQSAKANNAGDIAIGQSSNTSTKHTVSDIKIGDTTLSKGVAATDNGTVSFGNENVKRQIQNVGAGEISENSSDAITGSQLYSVIKATDEIAKTEYKFQVNGTDIKTMRNNDTSAANNANNTLNFKAGDGLEVAYENGAVTYKLNADSKQAIADAKTAAQTVTTKLNEINKSVQRAETAASNAASSASAASTSASAASSSASAANSSATAASNSASAASSSATAASDSASAASSSASAASTSASAASSSASAASTSASAASSSASAANSSATAASNSASAASSSATAASNSASAASDSASAASSSASAANSSATAASNSASAASSSATAASDSAS